MKAIVILLFLLFLQFSIAFSNEQNKGQIKIYIDNPQITELSFKIAQILTSKTKIPIIISFSNPEYIKNHIYEGKKIDLIITKNYKLISELKSLGIINLSFVHEAFHDKLVYISSKSIRKSKSSIFLKSQKEDSDIFDSKKNLIPSVVLSHKNICKTINESTKLYLESYDGIIIKQSIASKCKLQYSQFFNKKYDTYYIVIVVGNDFALSKKITQTIKKSEQIRSAISNNGFF